MSHRAINFSPFANNVLDYLGKELCTPGGTKVVITKPTIDFVVRFNDVVMLESNDNLSVSYFLNQREVGVVR